MKMQQQEILKKYWRDPVWSKVISFIIISLGSSILTAIYISIQSIYNNESVIKPLRKITNYFSQSTEINNFLLCFFLIILISFLVSFLNVFYKRNTKTKNDIVTKQELKKTGFNSNILFANQLSGAFPGHRGFNWYYSKEAVKRLDKFFQTPLFFKPLNDNASSNPFWWFRAYSSMYVDRYTKISKQKILLGVNELKIKRIGVFVSPIPSKSFIYVETSGESQTGIYNYTEKDILDDIKNHGYSYEEYAIFNKKHKISRAHYDDGATIIKGKLIDTFDSELRIKYLTDYNFIFAAHQSKFNSDKFERESGEYFNKILTREIDSENFIEYLKNYK